MEFRWVACITLWTMLIGPVMDRSSGPSTKANSSQVRHKAVAKLTPGR